MALSMLFWACSSQGQLTKPTAAANQVQAQTSNDWKPATFKGLTVGKSLESDVISTLGKPISVSKATDDGDAPRNTSSSSSSIVYRYNEGFDGDLVFEISKQSRVVNSAILYPEHLTLSHILSMYGDDYVKTRYEILECPGDAGASFIRESPSGSLQFLEYRSKGIVVDEDDSTGSVRSIEFVSGPIGKTKCP